MDREIWRLHSEGHSTREIPLITTSGRGTVWRTIERLRKQMLEFVTTVEATSVTKEDVVMIRPRKEADDTFIFHSFLNTLYYAGSWRATRPVDGRRLPFMPKDVAFKYRTVLEHIIKKPNVSVKVCCLKDDPDIIVGYSITEEMVTDTILHWVYVREDWQREGIGTDLCPRSFTLITHLTKDAKAVLAHLSNKGIRPKLISLPITYEILENTFQAEPIKPMERERPND